MQGRGPRVRLREHAVQDGGLVIGQLGAGGAGLVGQLVLGGEGEDRGRDPEPDRAAGDLEHVDQPARQAGAGGIERGDPRGGHRRVEEPGPEPGHGQPGDQRPVAGVRVDQRQQEGADRQPGGAKRDRRLRAQPLVDGAGEERDQGEGAEHRHHAEPRLEGRVVEDLLHELRRVQHGGEEDRRHQQHGQAGGAKLDVAKHVRRHQGALPHPRLDQGEGDHEQDRHREHRDHAGVAEAPVGRLVEGQQGQEQPGRQRDDPG